MPKDVIPRKKIGVLAPRGIVENGLYEFYQLAPRSVMQTIVPLGIKKFTPEGVEEVFKNIDEQLDQLMLRKVHAIAQEGVPLQCLIGTEAHDKRLAYIHEKTGVPVTSGVPGGSWSLNSVVVDLETHYGQPILAHRHVAAWDMCRMVGMWKPKRGYGRLLATA